jgi:hypothetical protein
VLDGSEDEVPAEEQPEEKHPRDEHRELELAVIQSSGRDPVPLVQRAALRRNPELALGRRDVRPIFGKIIGRNFRSRIFFRLLFAAQDLLDVEVLARIGSVRINGLSLAGSLLGGGSLFACPLRLILGNLAKFFRPRLTSLCLTSQLLRLATFGVTSLLSSLRTLLGLLCARKRSLSLKAQPLSFALLSLPLLLSSLHRRPYDDHEQDQDARNDDHPQPARHGFSYPPPEPLNRAREEAASFAVRAGGHPDRVT